jgi:hypothetical protein
MSFYDEMATVARDLLAEFGAPIAFTRVTGEVRNPATGQITTPGTTTTLTANGVVVPIRARLVDGTRIKAGDKDMILDDTFEPLMSDKTTGWSIQEITPSNPAGTPLVYFVRVRA